MVQLIKDRFCSKGWTLCSSKSANLACAGLTKRGPHVKKGVSSGERKQRMKFTTIGFSVFTKLASVTDTRCKSLSRHMKVAWTALQHRAQRVSDRSDSQLGQLLTFYCTGVCYLLLLGTLAFVQLLGFVSPSSETDRLGTAALHLGRGGKNKLEVSRMEIVR